MARVARRYDLYLPLRYNDGTPIEREKFKQVDVTLLERFGGLTAVKQENPLRGVWRGEAVVYEDEVVVFSVIDFHPRRGGRQFFECYKEALKADFQQEEVLITVQSLEVL
jgi:hypothetical protein